MDYGEDYTLPEGLSADGRQHHPQQQQQQQHQQQQKLQNKKVSQDLSSMPGNGNGEKLVGLTDIPQHNRCMHKVCIKAHANSAVL